MGKRPRRTHAAGVGYVFALAIGLATAASADERLPPGAASCPACHAGSGIDAPVSLSELAPETIAGALAAYRTGERQGTIMPRIAQGFTEREARAIADALGKDR